jgi:hypothetical protein
MKRLEGPPVLAWNSPASPKMNSKISHDGFFATQGVDRKFRGRKCLVSTFGLENGGQIANYVAICWRLSEL